MYQAFECFELGRVAYEKNDYYHSNKWLKEALEQAKIGKDADNELNVEILYYLSLSTRKIGLQIQVKKLIYIEYNSYMNI